MPSTQVQVRELFSIFKLTLFYWRRTYKLCLSSDNQICSEEFSFDIVNNQFFSNSQNLNFGQINISEIFKIFPDNSKPYNANASDVYVENTTPEYIRKFEQSQNVSKTKEELENEDDRRKLMLILGRVIEFCLLFLIIVTSLLCFILLCSIKFC